MQRLPFREIMYLMAARRPRRDHERLRLLRERWQQTELRDGDAEVVVLAFVAEASGHAAAAGIEEAHVEAGDQLQEVGGASHADEGFLMAVAVDDRFIGEPSGVSRRLSMRILNRRLTPL